jgi:2-hydroxycyclohexanecarboxyl-CoA dehydrogenase
MALDELIAVTPDPAPFRGRVAFVTGGASGIGAATARRLASAGAAVVVADIDAPGTSAICGDIDGLGLECDVTDARSVRASVAAAEATAGPIDVLVNNAGGGVFAMFVDTDEHLWDSVLAVNLRGVIACTHAVLPGMYERRRGAIVNVASEAGRVGAVAGAIYAAAKAGVIGLTKAVARESARFGVRCNAVAPGPVDTPLLNGPATSSPLGARAKQGMIDATLFKRMGTPDEVAGAIAFLASDEASFITGHTLAVSGGLAMT